MNRDRERYDNPSDMERRYRNEDYGDRDDDVQPYGVGAEAAYGVPADDRYFSRRYRAHLPTESHRRFDEPRHKFPLEQRRPFMQRDREDWDDSEWERQSHGHFPKPGYNPPVSGQVSQGGFWTADLDGPHRGPVTGDELRGHGHFLDHDYEAWREDQLRAHDRDYREWREERRRAYDTEYANWCRERRDKFGKDFTDWRTQRSQSQATPATSPTEDPEKHKS
jgi:hypothetical protein